MKKIIIILALLLNVGACGNQYIKPGNYVLVNKNERPIYLIDINSGERLIELKADKFYVNIVAGKRIASFIVEYTNFNTESSSIRQVELGFFNGKIRPSKVELPEDYNNGSVNAIIIQPTIDLESAENGEVIGVTLSSYGPVLYSDYRDGYYYFYLGVNYLRVREAGTTLIKKPEGSNSSQQVFDGELSDYAFGFLTLELQQMIKDHNDAYEEMQSIDNNGIVLSNKDLSREFSIANQDVIVITYINMYDESLQLAVYLEANTYGFLGIRLINLEAGTAEEEPE